MEDFLTIIPSDDLAGILWKNALIKQNWPVCSRHDPQEESDLPVDTDELLRLVEEHSMLSHHHRVKREFHKWLGNP
jgi:hypothetical protein